MRSRYSRRGPRNVGGIDEITGSVVSPMIAIILAAISWLWAREWPLAVFFVVWACGMPYITAAALIAAVLWIIRSEVRRLMLPESVAV